MTERAVRSALIVIDAPSFDLLLGSKLRRVTRRGNQTGGRTARTEADESPRARPSCDGGRWSERARWRSPACVTCRLALERYRNTRLGPLMTSAGSNRISCSKAPWPCMPLSAREQLHTQRVAAFEEMVAPLARLDGDVGRCHFLPFSVASPIPNQTNRFGAAPTKQPNQLWCTTAHWIGPRFQGVAKRAEDRPTGSTNLALLPFQILSADSCLSRTYCKSEYRLQRQILGDVDAACRSCPVRGPDVKS